MVVGNSGVENYKFGWRTVGVGTIRGGGEQVYRELVVEKYNGGEIYPNDPQMVSPPGNFVMLSRLNRLDLCGLFLLNDNLT